LAPQQARALPESHIQATSILIDKIVGTLNATGVFTKGAPTI
jgi:hypothetical protein